MPRRSAGEGQIRQRANGTWEARYIAADGRRPSVYGKTKREVPDRLRDALGDAASGIRPVDRQLTTGRYLTDWLEHHVMVRLYLVPSIGRISLAKLQPEHVTAMLRGIEGKRGPLSPSTVRYAYKVLRIAMGRAVKLGHVQRNVCTLIDPPTAPRREVQPMSAEQARAFLGSVRGDRHEVLYRLALATGMRQGELLALRWQDIDLDGRVLVVRHTLQRRTGELVDPKTPRARRYVALDDVTVALLRQHRSGQKVVSLMVFTSSVGTPLDPRNVLRAYQDALARAGLPRWTFHSLRHATATLLLESGEELANVSKLLGHADLGTTADLYGHLTPQIARQASERLGAVLAG